MLLLALILSMTSYNLLWPTPSPLTHLIWPAVALTIYKVKFASLLTYFDPQLIPSTGANIRELVCSHLPHDTLVFTLPWSYRNTKIIKSTDENIFWWRISQNIQLGYHNPEKTKIFQILFSYKTQLNFVITGTWFLPFMRNYKTKLVC